MKIYHTNDIHSNFDFYKKTSAYINENKNDEDLYLDSGDFADLSNFIVQADRVQSALELAFSFKLDAMAIGNNELDLGYDAISNLVNKFPLLSANVSDGSGNLIEGLKGSIIIRKNDINFLIVALSPYFNSRFKAGAYNTFLRNGNLITTDPYEAIERELDANKGKYDFLILLSHSGLWMDEIFIKKYPQIDLILGGHSHDVWIDRKYSQSGRGENLGIIDLSIIDKKLTIESIDHKYLDEKENMKFDEIYKSKSDLATNILSQEIAAVDSLSYEPYEECQFINFICDSILDEMSGDLAIMHNGIANHSLVKPISRLTLLDTIPSKLNPTKYKVKGSDILEAISLSQDQDYIRRPSRGPGFRGTIIGDLSFSSNVKIQEDPLKVTIDNEELDPVKEYTIVSHDYIQRGSIYPSLKTENKNATWHKLFIRDLMEKYLNNQDIFDRSLIKRKISK